MSDDTTTTIAEEESATLVAALVSVLDAVAERATFPELLSSLHKNGKCLALTNASELVAAMSSTASALAAAGITLRRHRVRGSRQMMLICRERTAH